MSHYEKVNDLLKLVLDPENIAKLEKYQAEEMAKHDKFCSASTPRGQLNRFFDGSVYCSCEQSAKIRQDEREKVAQEIEKEIGNYQYLNHFHEPLGTPCLRCLGESQIRRDTAIARGESK